MAYPTLHSGVWQANAQSLLINVNSLACFSSYLYPFTGHDLPVLKLLLGGFFEIYDYMGHLIELGRDKMLETTNMTYHLSSAQDPQVGNCYSNQRPNRPKNPTKNNPYCVGYDSPNSKKHRVPVPAHFTLSRGNPYPSFVRLRRLRRLCLGFGVGSLQPLQDFRLAMVNPVVTDSRQCDMGFY